MRIRLVKGIFFYFLIVWIRIRIRNTNPDPFSNTDPDPQKWLKFNFAKKQKIPKEKLENLSRDQKF